MKTLRRLAVLAALLPVLASAAVVHGVTTQAKLDFLNGVNLSGSTYKASLLPSSATAGAATTTWASISGSEITCTGTCTGWAAGGWTLASRAVAASGTTGQLGWATPLTVTSATITAAALVIYNSTSGYVLSIHCLDGTTGTCSASTTSTAGTFTVNISATATITIARMDPLSLDAALAALSIPYVIRAEG